MIKVEWDKYRLFCLRHIQMPAIAHGRCSRRSSEGMRFFILPEETNLVPNIFQNQHVRAGCEEMQNLEFSWACYTWKYYDATCVYTTNLNMPQETPKNIYIAKLLEWSLLWFQTTEEQHFCDPLLSTVQNLAQSRNHFQDQLLCAVTLLWRLREFSNMERCCSIPADLNASEWAYF